MYSIHPSIDISIYLSICLYTGYGLSIYISVYTGYGRKEAVDILLAAGGNVHARDDGGLIPLHNACSFGHAEVTLVN